MVKCILVLAICLLFSCSSSTRAKLPYSANVVERLKQGNKRFRLGQSIHPHITPQRIAQLATSQHPFAIIISCSDSRVSPELIFDQGLGDLFVIRTAGNVLSTLEIGSIEYAIEHLNVATIVVMGHEECGALKALAENSKEAGNLGTLIHNLEEEPEVKAIKQMHPSVNTLVQANIKHAMSQIISSSGIAHEKERQGKLTIVAAEYYLHDGRVDFLKI